MAERTIHDETLGTLTWNDDLDWWEGRWELSPGQVVGVSLSTEEDDPEADPTPELEKLHRMLPRIREQEPEARQLAADELLDIYNEEWSNGEELTEEEFIARLSLVDVSLAPDGSAELFYNDGGLFTGHSVLVTLDADGNLQDADIAG